MPHELIAAATAPLQQTIAQQAAVIQQQEAQIQQFPAYVQQQLQQQYEAIVGGSTPQARATLIELNQHLASNDTAAKQLLARTGTLEQNLTTTQAGLAAATTGVAEARALAQRGVDEAAKKLPLAGGVLTGPVVVVPPTDAGNPLQFSSLPLSMAVTQQVPLIALGTLYSFTVPVANVVVGQVVLLNVPPSLASSLSYREALVTGPGIVTIYLKAGVQVSAASLTFYLRVFR